MVFSIYCVLSMFHYFNCVVLLLLFVVWLFAVHAAPPRGIVLCVSMYCVVLCNAHQ